MNHLYHDVPKLGTVAVSRHAQAKQKEEGISDREFEDALFAPLGDDLFNTPGVRWREKNGIRLIILDRPEPFRGAKLIVTLFRVEGQAKLKLTRYNKG